MVSRIGSSSDDTFYGTEGFDYLYGGPNWSNDKLYGRGGNDHLWGGHGSDTLDGGKGNDWLWSDRTPGSGADTLIFRLGDGFDYIVGLDVYDTLEFLWGDAEVGRFRFAEDDGNPVIVYGDGGTDDGTVHSYYSAQAVGAVGGDGGGTILIGHRTLAEFKASGIGFTIRGGDGDNTLHGAFGRDKIYGGAGDDTSIPG